MNDIISTKEILSQIFYIRAKKVMVDVHLAMLYQVETRALNQAVQRNISRFPDDFMFRLSQEEFDVLKSQFVISSWGGRRKLPYAFTEQGIAMLSGILRSEKAITVNIAIMRAFVQMRELIDENKGLKKKLDELDYEKFYDLESYLFNDVRDKFHKHHYISAFDFFCIIIWKANRAKTTILKRLKLKEKGDLETFIKKLTNDVFDAVKMEDKLSIMMNKENGGFLLPMASAILTVLYPDNFTIYDFRVCDSLEGENQQGDFHKLSNIDKTKVDKIWEGYLKFKGAVIQKTPSDLSLRDKDRYLWGMSFKDSLDKLLKN